MSKNLISRRDFLKGAAVSAVGVAAIGLTGCGQSAPAAATQKPAASQPIITAKTAGAYLNPQDYDYTSNSIKDFSKTTLFSDWKFGPLTLHHRMVKSAAGSDTQKSWQKTPEEMSTYYSNFAKGGVEMVWMEDVFDLYKQAFPQRQKASRRF